MNAIRPAMSATCGFFPPNERKMKKSATAPTPMMIVPTIRTTISAR